MMTHVWITQCLCPQRHTILAGAGEARDFEHAVREYEDPLRQQLSDAISSGVMNPWCGLCHAGIDTWRYETARTRFRTLAEALPALKAIEAKQIITASVMGELLGTPTRH
jgi:hypothetical protein